MTEFDDQHTHPGGGQPPVKGKDLIGAMPSTICSASTELQISDDTEYQGSETSYTTIHSFKIYVPGTVRVSYQGKREFPSNYQYAKIVVSGGDEVEEELTSSYVTYTDDMDVTPGATVSVQAKTTNAAVDYFIRNYKVYFTIDKSDTGYEIITE